MLPNLLGWENESVLVDALHFVYNIIIVTINYRMDFQRGSQSLCRGVQEINQDNFLTTIIDIEWFSIIGQLTNIMQKRSLFLSFPWVQFGLYESIEVTRAELYQDWVQKMLVFTKAQDICIVDYRHSGGCNFGGSQQIYSMHSLCLYNSQFTTYGQVKLSTNFYFFLFPFLFCFKI